MKTATRGIIYTALAGFMVFSTGCKSPNIGLDNNALKPCPDSPNCVSSMAEDPSHHVDPFQYNGTAEDAKKNVKKKLISIIESTKRARVVTSKENYIHAEFTSLIFRFVDDVEFYFDDQAPVIHVRSASRVGYSDFGANRKRIEEIRQEFNQ
jgi:uncharacterized protein (DUF1499 family)